MNSIVNIRFYNIIRVFVVSVRVFKNKLYRILWISKEIIYFFFRLANLWGILCISLFNSWILAFFNIHCNIWKFIWPILPWDHVVKHITTLKLFNEIDFTYLILINNIPLVQMLSAILCNVFSFVSLLMIWFSMLCHIMDVEWAYARVYTVDEAECHFEASFTGTETFIVVNIEPLGICVQTQNIVIYRRYSYSPIYEYAKHHKDSW